jgi:hypothetical protein
MTRALRVLGWMSIALLTLVVSAILHLATPLGRAAAADGLAKVLTSRVRGTAHVGEVTRLDFDGIEMRDFTVTSPTGERVLAAERMETEFAFGESLRRGAIVLTPCELEGGEMRITHGPRDQIDLIYSMEVPDDRFTVPVEIRDIRLIRQTMIMGLPGLPGRIEMKNVHGLADMKLGHQFSARMDQVRGIVNVPIVDVGFERLNGRLRSDDRIPMVVRMVLDLDVAEPSMEIRYAAPRAIGEQGEPGLGIELGVDVPEADED